MKTFRHVLCAVISFAAAACASQADTGSRGGVATSAASSTAGIDVLRQGGTFAFALDESDPAARIHASCAQDSGGDTAKDEACYARIAAVARNEGIRFSTDEEGRVVWTSFGRDERDREEIYIQVPLTLTAEGARFVRGVPAAHGDGTQVPPSLSAKTLPFEIVDVNTIIMNDPRKGRLVFHRSAI